MFLHHIIQAIFVLTGTTALLAALLDWDWFFTARNAEFVVKRIGRTKSRWLYGVAGVLIAAAGIYFYFRIKNM